MWWNQNTVGDMIESLMGLHDLMSTKQVENIPSFPFGFVRFLHDWCLAMYRYSQATAWKFSYAEISMQIKLRAVDFYMLLR